jgi:hypothetical protein
MVFVAYVVVSPLSAVLTTTSDVGDPSPARGHCRHHPRGE